VINFDVYPLDIESLCEDSLLLRRFMGFNERSIEALSGPYLWFSPIKAFNDPFEAECEYVFTPDPERVIEAYVYSYSSGYPIDTAAERVREDYLADKAKFMGEMESRFRSVYLQAEQDLAFYYCCLFSERTGSKTTPEQLALMWSHYGDGLRGIRITYNPKMLLASLNEQRDIRALFMSYMDQPPVIDLIEGFAHVTGIKGPRFTADLFRENPRVKSSVWEYEKEFRIVSLQPGPIGFDPAAIVSVDIGERMKDAQKKVIQLLMRQLNPAAAVNIARVRPGTFHVDYEPI